MAAINADLENRGHTWGEAYAKAVSSTKDFSVLKPIRIGIDTALTGGIARLTAMKNVAGSEEFKNAELNYLHFELESVNTAFKSFEDLTTNVTQEELDARNAQMTEIGKKENELLKHLREMQAAYAKKNNFNINPAPAKQ